MSLQTSTSVYISRGSEIAARMLGGCMMIMSARDSSLFSLNEIGSLIWNAADGSTSLDTIVQNLICSEFDVPFAEARADAEAFVSELAEHDILKVSDQPISAFAAAEQR